MKGDDTRNDLTGEHDPYEDRCDIHYFAALCDCDKTTGKRGRMR